MSWRAGESLKMSSVNKHVKFHMSQTGLIVGCPGRENVRKKKVVKLTPSAMGKIT